jgi:glc operon protein GlcG
MYQTYHLSHTDALKIVAAIQAELEKTNQAAAIAVADAHGELIAFLRLDGCKLPSLTIAINKAPNLRISASVPAKKVSR